MSKFQFEFSFFKSIFFVLANDKIEILHNFNDEWRVLINFLNVIEKYFKIQIVHVDVMITQNEKMHSER